MKSDCKASMELPIVKMYMIIQLIQIKDHAINIAMLIVNFLLINILKSHHWTGLFKICKFFIDFNITRIYSHVGSK